MFRIPINLKDRFDFLLFQVVFTKGFIKQISKRASWLSKIFKRARRDQFLQYAIILNVQHFMFERYPETDPKLTSTIFMKFYEAELLNEKFCLKWKNGELDSILPQHFLYTAENYPKLKENAKDFLDWLENEGGSDSEDSDDSSGSDSDSGSGSDSGSSSDNE